METAQLHTLQDLLTLAAGERPDKVYLREKAGKEIAEKTFGGLLEDARKLSSFLRSQGGEAVHAGLVGSSSIAYITCLMGTVIDGHWAVPIDPQLGTEEITDNLNRADVTVLFYDQRFQPMVDTLRETCPQITACVCFTPGEGGSLSAGASCTGDTCRSPPRRSAELRLHPLHLRHHRQKQGRHALARKPH